MLHLVVHLFQIRNQLSAHEAQHGVQVRRDEAEHLPERGFDSRLLKASVFQHGQELQAQAVEPLQQVGVRVTDRALENQGLRQPLTGPGQQFRQV